MSGNAHDLFDVPPTPQWQQNISSVGLGLGKQDYQAIQMGTVYIPNGNGLQVGVVNGQLNTTIADGLHVEHDDHYNMTVKVPIFTTSGLKQMQDNFAWAKDKIFPKSAPIEKPTVMNHPKLEHKRVIKRVAKRHIDVDERPHSGVYQRTYSNDEINDYTKSVFTQPTLDADDEKPHSGEYVHSYTDEEVNDYAESVFQQSSAKSSSTSYITKGLGLAQAASSVVELGEAAALTAVTAETGVGLVIGCALALNALDNLNAGIQAMRTGEHYDTFLSSGLQRTGLNETKADLIDGAVSIVASTGALLGSKIARFGLFANSGSEVGVGRDVYLAGFHEEESLPNFASQLKLEDHYNKHGARFMGIYSTPDEYLQGAHDVITQGIKVSYIYKYEGKEETRIGYVRFMGNSSRDGSAKFEFVGTNHKGNITTYHVKSGKDMWNTLNKDNKNQNILSYDYLDLTNNNSLRR